MKRNVNAIHSSSECYSLQRKFDRRWFVCFVLFVCFVCFVFFILFLLFFRGRGLV